ncbi:hypothetical protein NH340_JMT08092 [Sarcoptes scabiei]|uniref:Small integral membrane protein 20 n=1 Tax=Sarcoptes scabiei TaxID=52283 RepID=A0A834RFX0_SARSC|nr:hypothetical protein NH340_JMT08092 [Sarcoptes scabiei]
MGKDNLDNQKRIQLRDLKLRKVNMKETMIVGGFILSICLALVPIYIYPYLNIEKYQKIQMINRKNIDPNKIQPGNMRIWSDPFSPRDDK